MAEHISNVTFERIKPIRMVNNFKIDENNCIWYLWSSSMRSESLKDKPNKLMNVPPLSLNEDIKVTDKIR